MRILGVIDLRDGRAVHATGGERAGYREVASAGDVHIGGDPLALASYYRDEYGLGDLYVADLDAIAGRVPQAAVVRTVVAAGLDVWLDTGMTTPAEVGTAFTTGAKTAIVGLETLPGYASLERLCSTSTAGPLALSLDMRDGRPVCCPGCDIDGLSAERVALGAWEAGIGTIIVLDLARVGRQCGPSLDVIARVQTAVPGARVLAGGGVRSAADLHDLKAMGVAGVLMATALHQGTVSRDQLHSILMR